MNYNFGTLFFTRTLEYDYKWYCRPEYVDDSINELLRPLFLMVESQSYKKFFEENGRYNFYFLTEKNYCVLCYLYFTPYEDSIGRRIYALEGLTCEKKDARMVWKNLPSIIYNMFEPGDMGNQGISAYIPDWYNIRDYSQLPRSVSIPCNDYMCSKEKMLDRFGGKVPVFLNLIEELYSVPKIYSFIFGTKAESYYMLEAEKVYCINEPRRQIPVYKEYLSAPVCSEPCDVRCYFSKEFKEYNMNVMILSKRNELIWEYDNYFVFDKEGIPYWFLGEMKDWFEENLQEFGYTGGGNVKEKDNRQFGFNVVQENYVSELDMSVHHISGKMKKNGGMPEQYSGYVDKVIRQLFQYSQRVKKRYYSRKRLSGMETIYILNFESALWIFGFVKNETTYFLEGIVPGGADRQSIWMKLGKILKKYFYDEEKYSEEYQCAFENYRKDMEESIYPLSAVITSMPASCFPVIDGLNIYSVSTDKIYFEAIRENETWEISEGDDYYLIPPALFKRTWYFQKKDSKMDAVPVECIQDGYCNLEQLLEELKAHEKYFEDSDC